MMQNNLSGARLQILGLAILLSYVTTTSGWQGNATLRYSIYSGSLKEKQVLKVILPGTYQACTKQKDGVLHVPDGEWSEWVMQGSYNFAMRAKLVAEKIFRHIRNIYSKGNHPGVRDITPTGGTRYRISGGAGNVRSFLKNDLHPIYK